MTEQQLIDFAKKIAAAIGGEYIDDGPLEGEPASIVYEIDGEQFVLGVLPL